MFKKFLNESNTSVAIDGKQMRSSGRTEVGIKYPALMACPAYKQFVKATQHVPVDYISEEILEYNNELSYVIINKDSDEYLIYITASSKNLCIVSTWNGFRAEITDLKNIDKAINTMTIDTDDLVDFIKIDKNNILDTAQYNKFLNEIEIDDETGTSIHLSPSDYTKYAKTVEKYWDTFVVKQQTSKFNILSKVNVNKSFSKQSKYAQYNIIHLYMTLEESGDLEFANESYVKDRLNFLLLNESDVQIKRFANESEAAITLPNGNITYTTDAGKTWETKFVNEANKLDIKAIANQFKEDLPELSKVFAKISGFNLKFDVTAIRSSTFDVESKQNLVDELGELGKLFIKEIYVDFHVYVYTDKNSHKISLGAHVNYKHYDSSNGKSLELPEIIYDIQSRTFSTRK